MLSLYDFDDSKELRFVTYRIYVNIEDRFLICHLNVFDCQIDHEFMSYQ